MRGFHIPASGVSLYQGPTSGKISKDGPVQVLRLDLAENTTNGILRSLKNNETATLRLGKKTIVQFGDQKLFLQQCSDTFPSEIYRGTESEGSPMYFSGRLSHTLEVQKAQEATAKTDEALAALENTLKSMQEQRASNEASFVRNKDEMKQVGKKDHKPTPLQGQHSAIRKDHFLGGMSRSTPSSPYLNASYSPRHAPTSAPLPASGFGTVKDKVRFDAMKTPIVHLLASRPMTPKNLYDVLHAPKDECDKVLDKYARECRPDTGKRELKEKSYRELDVWKFPYKSEDEREAAISHAIQAFDRMRIEKTDPLWQMLLRPEERGKGKTLSRLNFDKPIPRPSTPKPEGHGQDGADVSDVELMKGRKRGSSDAKVTASPAKKKKLNEKKAVPKTKTQSEHGGIPREKALHNTVRPAKAPAKYKSAERIEDSDEETADVEVVKPVTSLKIKQPSPNTPAQPPRRPQSPSPKKQLHKSGLSNSSTNSEKNEKPESSASDHHKGLKARPNGQNSSSRISPRPRTGSSPQKPSPLGSSPPANSTDLDSSGSSKAPSQSSAPSSPPSSTDMPLAKKNNKYSPIITEKRHDVSRGRSPVKRKSDSSEDGPPAKRFQVNGIAGRKMDDSGLSRGQESHRKFLETERSSSPEKPGINRNLVIDEAKWFQKYYKKYKDLHIKIAGVPEKEREDKDLETLWKMHKRLKEMKNEIWDNWGRVEKTEIAV